MSITRCFSLFLLVAVVPVLSFAQVSVGEIKEVAPLNKKYTYRFPHIAYPTNKTVAAKINNTLVFDFLRIDPKKVRKSIFEVVWPQQKDAMPELNDLDWIIHSNYGRVFSLAISAEGCGAYCEYFTNYYSFDLTTGKLLTLDLLITKEGLLFLKDSVNKLKKERLQNEIKTYKKILSDTATHLDKDLRQGFERTVELYQDCLDKGGVASIPDLSFYLRGGLFIHIDRCSVHYNRALDELGEFEFLFAYPDLKPYLTPYAQQLKLQ